MIFRVVLVLFLSLAAALGQAIDASEMVRRSQKLLEEATTFEIAQKTEQVTATVMEGNAPGPVMKAVTDSTFEVRNKDPKVIRMTRPLPGNKNLVVIRYKEKVAVKNGDEDWKPPEGIFLRLKAQMADLYACPLPGGVFGGPKWQRVKDDQAAQAGLVVLETVKNSAVEFAEKKINEGLKLSSTDEIRAKAKVKEYHVKQWVSDGDFRRLRWVETTRYSINYISKDTGAIRKVEIHSTNTALFRNYDKVKLTLPPEAARLLSGQ